MMKLYYSPGVCSLGIHVLLEDLGVPYEAEIVSLRDGGQHRPEYRAINPKGKVPTLVRDDGSVLTEWATIAYWLGLAYPERGLLSPDSEVQVRTLEFLEYAVATVHMRGFTLVAMPQRFSANPAAHSDVRAVGEIVRAEGLALLSEKLGDQDYFFGGFSIADAAVFYLTFWAVSSGCELPENIAAFHQRMLSRPAVQAAMRAEGLS